MSVKAQLAEAKDLISQKRFDEARYILSNLEHPVAKEWLAKLDKVAPASSVDLPQDDEWARTAHKNRNKQRKTYTPTKSKKSAQGGISMTMVAIVGVALLAVGGLVAFVFLNPDISPIAPSDETGCGAQDWYNPFNGTIGDIIYSNPWDIVDDEQMAETLGVVVFEDAANNRRYDLHQRIRAIENSPAPDCIAGADDALLEALQAQVNVVDRLSADNPNAAFYNIGVSVDKAKEAFNEMLAVGVQFRGSDNRAITQLTDPVCPALDWAFRVMYTENQFLVLVLNTDDLITATSVRDAIINFSADFSQQEVQLKYNIATPPCMQEAKAQMLTIMESYRGALDSLRGDLYNSLLTAMPYHQDRINAALDAFYAELRNAGVDEAQFGGGGAYTFGIR
ncbi:MAG: hypothetical protein CL607_00300 [Anaerolineaceae bacterium]|nr:hypothetical protein [Anaerolineaceae bacterium]